MKYRILVLLILLSSCVIYGNDRKQLELKSSGTAVGASLAGTLLPSLPLLAFMGAHDYIVAGSIALSISGFIYGSSAGHFYAGNSARGSRSVAFRAVILVFGAAGSLLASVSTPDEHVIAKATAICILGSAAYDIFTCPKSVEKYNQSILDQGGLYFSPEIDLQNESYGLSLSYKF